MQNRIVHKISEDEARLLYQHLKEMVFQLGNMRNIHGTLAECQPDIRTRYFAMLNEADKAALTLDMIERSQ